MKIDSKHEHNKKWPIPQMKISVHVCIPFLSWLKQMEFILGQIIKFTGKSIWNVHLVGPVLYYLCVYGCVSYMVNIDNEHHNKIGKSAIIDGKHNHC